MSNDHNTGFPSEKMESSSSAGLRLVAYSTNTWVSPLAHLRILGPAHQTGMQVVFGTEGEQDYSERVTQADLVIIQRDFPRRVKTYERILSLARQQGKPVIYDLDDLLLELPDDHPDQINHYYSAALLPMIRALIEADVVTVSTLPLRDYVHRFNPRVHVLPNYLDSSIWKFKSPAPPERGSSPLVIAYVGGPSHASDLSMIEQPLRDLARRYGSTIRMHFVGPKPPPRLIDEPNVSWEASPTFEYRKFAAFLAEQEYNIYIAPLRDNQFNRCKSAIKYLEYASTGAPGVYSNITPYQSVVRHGENGLLASSPGVWDEQLSRLIESPELRFQIATKAQDDLRSHWMMVEHAVEWQQLYQTAIDQVSITTPTIPAEDSNNANLAALSDEVKLIHRLSIRLQSYYDRLRTAPEYDENKLTTLRNRIEITENQVKALNDQLQQLAKERDMFSSSLWTIHQTRAFQALQRWRDLRAWLKRLRINALSQAPIPGSGKSEGFLGIENPVANAETPLAASQLAGDRAAMISDLEGLAPREPSQMHYDVIVLPILDWTDRFQRPQQMAMQFARTGHRVFYLRTTFHPGNIPRLRQVAPNIIDVHLPAPRSPNLYKDTLDFELVDKLLSAWQTIQQNYQINSAVLLVELPYWAPLAQCLKSHFTWPIVYDCMDEHAGFSSNSPVMVAQETSLVQSSNLVIVTSHRLMQAWSPLNQHTVYIPNGTDYPHFRFPTSKRPTEIKNLHGPIIGYYGAIADWFDSSLVAALAQARPGWNFVLIGSTWSADLTPFQGLNNVHLLGEKPYSSLPPYLHAFDVAMIPFKKTPLTQSTNPVKLFEYLSAGKPVVASDLDELRNYRQQAQLAHDFESWLQALEQALAPQPSSVVETRFEFARQNTWEKRFQQLQAAFLSALPRVSVVIITYNNLDFTHLCLQSIFEKTQYPNYEVVVVDNASSDGTPGYLQGLASQHVNLQVVLNANNSGFASANNQGAALTTGEIIIFLNNDTVVTPGWMSGLARHLSDRQIGMVGPVTNSSGNETRISVNYQSLDHIDAFAARRSVLHFGQRLEVPMLAFLCVALRRDVFQEIGPLDESFGLGTFEDDDYALRVRLKGYRIVCAEDVFVHHWGSASFSKLPSEEMKRLFMKNRQRFEAKWGMDWSAHSYRKDFTPPESEE